MSKSHATKPSKRALELRCALEVSSDVASPPLFLSCEALRANMPLLAHVQCSVPQHEDILGLGWPVALEPPLPEDRASRRLDAGFSHLVVCGAMERAIDRAMNDSDDVYRSLRDAMETTRTEWNAEWATWLSNAPCNAIMQLGTALARLMKARVKTLPPYDTRELWPPVRCFGVNAGRLPCNQH